MGLHKLSVGDGYTYLTRQVAAHDTDIQAGRLGAYYTERGEAPGVWLGSGMADLGIAEGATVSEAQMTALFAHGRHPDAAVIEAAALAAGGTPEQAEKASRLGTPFRTAATVSELRRTVADRIGEWNLEHGRSACEPVGREVKSRIRTQVGRDLFTGEHGRAPADARELADFIATQSRVASDAVAGYDLTFSPVKSVSTLWAVADEATARAIEDAHHAAVVDTLAWIERTALFTRLGRNGVRQVEVRGLVAAAFTHRDSRAGDPDLHTHVAISNKVQTLDGHWRAVDGRVLHKATVAASERYNTRLEAELRERLGIRFSQRHGREAGKRGVREIAGVDPDLMRAWSSRRAAIDARRAELTTAFQAEHGRPPTPAEAIGLAQQATLATRHRKHPPRSQAEQRELWREEALEQLGPDGITKMFDTITRYSAIHAELLSDVSLNEQLIRRVAGRVVETIQAQRATWQPAHVHAETERQLRTLDLPLAELDDATDRVVDCVLQDGSVRLTRPDPLTVPDGLRRSDGTSVYEVAGSQLYTSRAVLAAEQDLLDAARRTDGRRADHRSVDVALLEATANDVPLNAGQVDLVRELAGSGARCQLALAPAGTGKTTALRVLARAWLEDGGDLLALAPSAAAARVLRDATRVRTDTIAKLLHLLDTDRLTPIGPRTLVLVDEAGMAGTTDLARLVRHVLAQGGSVRLIGDDRQLSAIGAGGILRDLAEQTGTPTLDTPVRFSDPTEADATLAIRDGHPSGLDFYLQHGRVHVGDEHTAPDSAYTAWTADRAAGRDTLLLAATRAQVTALNTRARADRLAAHPAPTGSTNNSTHAGAGANGSGREAALADGTAASAGDEIITRRNDRRLGITSTDWVKNGDRFTIRSVGDDASLTVVHRDTGRQLTLPGSYVAEHVALGYACTIHAGQGATADTSHTVLTGTESREQLYVALSRGRDANHLHLALPGATDPHAPIRRDTLIPPTAVDLLTRILDTQTGQRSASTEHRDLVNPNRRLHDAVTRYRDGHDTAPRSILTGPAGTPPLPWLPALPRDLDQSTAWGAYLHARAQQITDLAAAATAQTDKLRSPGDTRMAEGVSRMDPTLVNDLALWNATHPNHPPDEQLSEPERQYAQELDKRTQAVRAVWLTRGRDPRLLPPATREALAYADQHDRHQPTRQPEPRHTPPTPRPAPPVPYHRPPPGRGVSR